MTPGGDHVINLKSTLFGITFFSYRYVNNLSNILEITGLSLYLYLNKVLLFVEPKTETFMKQVGYYLRTSHFLQNIGIQVDKIEDGWKVYKDEGISGRISFQERPSGRKLIEDIKRGRIKEVMVLRIDRLGRDTRDILTTIQLIHSYKIPITSRNEGITTLDENGNQTPMTGLMINLLSSLSEFQYLQTREKTMDGILRGKLEGKYTGRKTGSVETIDKFLSKPKVKKIQELIKTRMSVRSISRIVECSPNYIYKVKEYKGKGQ